MKWEDCSDLMTVDEAAKMARVGTKEIYKRARCKGFPALRFGKNIRILREEFRRWCESNAGRGYERSAN